MSESREHPLSPATGLDTWVGGTPVTGEAEADGLYCKMQVTPGPYFLGELLAVSLFLRNDSQTTYTLSGPSKAGPCGAAVGVGMGSGSEPQYVLPVRTFHSCPPMITTLAPGDTLALHHFLPVSHMGEVTLEAGARFLQAIAGPNGSQRITNGPSPLDGLWPSIRMSVAAETPADRQITLQREGTQVHISAPLDACAHLYYVYNVSCHAFQGGRVGTGNFVWEPIATTVVQQPDCRDYGKQVIAWSYAVSAPGYAIASEQVSY